MARLYRPVLGMVYRPAVQPVPDGMLPHTWYMSKLTVLTACPWTSGTVLEPGGPGLKESGQPVRSNWLSLSILASVNQSWPQSSILASINHIQSSILIVGKSDLNLALILDQREILNQTARSSGDDRPND